MTASSRHPQRFFWIAFSLGMVLVVAAGLLFLWLQVHASYKAYRASEAVVLIPRGERVGEIARKLRIKGVIQSELLFRLYTRLVGDGATLKAGEYVFDRPHSLSEVVEILREGRVRYEKVTIPEGLDLTEIATAFVISGFGDLEAFRRAFSQTGLIRRLDPEAEDLEGYLFPETYYLTGEVDEEAIARMMVEGFLEFWTPALQERSRQLGMNTRQAVTLASLIEKETGQPRERGLVSSVFHNRLDRNMLLACDPTVIYAVKRVKEYDGVINRSDLELDSPYNTYRYPGLPPGPITNPGRESLLAALHPEESDFLFFVSRNDGTHIFSETHTEHSRAVQQYQR